MIRKRHLVALALVAITALGFVTFSVGSAGAWKCQYHPERPDCTPTTTVPVTVNTTIVQSTTTPSTVPDTTTSTPTTVPEVTTTTGPPPPPEVSLNPPSIERDEPPTGLKLAG